MKTTSLVLFALLLAGCGTLGAGNATPDQLKAAAGDHNAAGLCTIAQGYGIKVKNVYGIVDQPEKVNGTVTIVGDCDVTMDFSTKTAPVGPTK